MLSSAQGWSIIDGQFDYRMFHKSIVELFKVEDMWAQETLEWWNM